MAVLRTEYDHAAHGTAAVSVAASCRLNDGIQRSQCAVQPLKVKVYSNLDALGRHDPAGPFLLQPLTDKLDLPASVRGTQICGQKEKRILATKPSQRGSDLSSVTAQIDNGTDTVMLGHFFCNGFQGRFVFKPPFHIHPPQSFE